MSYQDGISRRQFVRISSGVAIAGAFAGLAGCSSGSGSGSASTSASAEASGSASANASASESASASASAASSAAAATQTVTDLKGATVEVPVEINKIADLWHAHNQVVLMLGAGDKLVGTTENFKNMPWSAIVYPRLPEVETLVVGSGAGEVNYEEALKLEPDVVFASDDEVTETARKQGLAALNVGFIDYQGLRDNVNLTAKVLGGDAIDIAKEWEGLLDDNIALVADRMKDVTGKKKRILHIANANDFTMVDGPKTIVEEWIKLAGGEIAIDKEGNRLEVTAEEILNSDPDVVIIGNAGPEDVERFKADEAFAGLRAIQEGNVFANPSGVFPWDRYSGEGALQVLWAAKQLNPDLFKDIDMVQETKDFYMQFYGCKLTDEQANMILAGERPK